MSEGYSENSNNGKRISLIPEENQKRNLKAMEAISSIYENTALLGDMSRRLPHIMQEIWKNSDKKELIKWALKITQVKK